ncbi:CPBP family intramembrane glutamic endopeptidase [Acetivibrio saccincola]|jgi:membrane protease YdiL (CAAX protease family)|uniref:CAAX amino terminal protease self-immunity n=1 Tax=Acetivibrio saccincola TaxID=1677857 RepID=A0A2K9ESF8_9FIRM|nr:type II CAAX endopeptidase family protein [Acetivibrio saccincola]AUG58480.1 CAAX amino terminal protease self- immunity [Acetivibrio saccincola]NLW26842.1 CPBP family intramembrane metalloprotease [Acetivibrio saccincola]PQQ66319.1 hypothetical protein B9R14_05850 [Acetivibrio saccincola]HOA97894.1 type II CAAX endopeptidase family protein [Acetivibrio saccincola]HQD28623.1 type II CAAX endopeptidase family protein [Acetivibrio saccincola]
MSKKFEMVGNILLYLLVFIISQFFASYIAMFVFFILNAKEIGFADIIYIQTQVEKFISQYTPAIYIVSFILSTIGYFTIFRLKKKNIYKEGGFLKIPFYKIFVLVFTGVAANIVVDFLLNYIRHNVDLEHTFIKYNTLIESILSSNNVILLLLSTGILYPFLEEVIFRGFIFNELRKNVSITKAIGIQAFLFGFLHLDPVQGTYAFLLGLFLAYIYLWTGSIWAPVALHVGVNSYAVMASKFPQFSLNGTLYLVLSVFVLIIGTAIIYKTRPEQN